MMNYQLVLSQRPGPVERDAGENIFLDRIPSDYKVYLFYYPGSMADETMESRLRALGEAAGKNLFVNIGSLSDTRHDRIVTAFGIKNYPVIVMTGSAELASPLGDYVTTYVRLDNRSLLNSPDRTIEYVEQLFNLFIQGELSQAISRAKWQQRTELLQALRKFFAGAFQTIGKFLDERDIAISVVEGKFELKRSGD